MRKRPGGCIRPSSFAPKAWRFAGLLLAGGLGSSGQGQVVMGYAPITDDNNDNRIFAAFATSGTEVYVVPFSFGFGGGYSLNSARFLLRGDANLADFSISISSSLATNLTPPATLVNFLGSGTLTNTPAVYTFTADTPAILTGASTYYLNVRYNGTNDANWIKSSVSSGGSIGTPGPTGDTGPTGDDGSPGSTGDTGPTGPTGDDGSPGSTGDTGPTGPTGDDGSPGSTGPPDGDTGDTGPTGDTGSPGPTGPTLVSLNLSFASNLTGNAGSDGFAPTLTVVDGVLTPPDPADYRHINGSGFTDHSDNQLGGFSITATAVPEPGRFAAIAGALTLAAALMVRRQHRRSPQT